VAGLGTKEASSLGQRSGRHADLKHVCRLRVIESVGRGDPLTPKEPRVTMAGMNSGGGYGRALS